MGMMLTVPPIYEPCPSPGVVLGPGHKSTCYLGMLQGCSDDLCSVAMEPQKCSLGSDFWVQLHLVGACITPLAEY